MKTRTLKTILITTGALGCLVALLLALRPAPPAQTPFAALADVPVLELPDAAAKLVANAPPAQRAAVAREVVQAVVALSQPGVTPFAVSAICRAAPDVAAEVVETAVGLQPSEALPISKAALVAAPTALESIVAAACRKAPQSYAAIAVVASEQVPASGETIFRGVATALPDLERPLEQARTHSVDASVPEVIAKTIELALSLPQEKNPVAAPDNGLMPASVAPPGLMQPPPRVSPPLTPYDPNNSVEFKISDSTVVTPGSARNYSAP